MLRFSAPRLPAQQHSVLAAVPCSGKPISDRPAFRRKGLGAVRAAVRHTEPQRAKVPTGQPGRHTVCFAAAGGSLTPNDGPSDQPRPLSPVPEWDRARGFGWLKFWAIWVAGVAVALALPLVLRGLAEMFTAATSTASTGLTSYLLRQLELTLDRMARLPVIAKILFVLAAGSPLVLAFGMAFHVVTGAPLSASLQRFYLLIFRMPGMSVTNDKTFAATLLVNLAYYVGLFSFAIFLGVVTDEVKTTFKSVKGGSIAVRESGHTVLLNWNKYTPLVLQTLATAKKADPCNSFYQRPVTVLAEKPKSEMDAAVKHLDLEMHMRTGNPALAKDLLRVAAHKAATVLVLEPEGRAGPGDTPHDFNCQAQVAATAMALSSLSSEYTPGQRLVLHEARGVKQHQSVNFLSTVKKTCDPMFTQHGGVQVAALSRHDLAQKFQALSAIQPGIVDMYSEILLPWGATLHTMPLPEALNGATYQQVRRSFDQGIICGVIQNGIVDMVPSDKQVLKCHDSTLVFLSHNSQPLVPSPAAQELFESVNAVTPKGKATQHKPPKILVVAMNARPVSDLSENFAQFALPGTGVTFVMPASSQKAAQAIALPSGVKFNFHFAQDNNPASVKALLDAGVGRDVDSVVIAGIASSELPPAEADHCIMAVMLQVQEAVRVSGRTKAPHVVARVRSNATGDAIKSFLESLRDVVPAAELDTIIRRPDILQMEHLIGGVLAQSASHKHFLPIIEHLLDSSHGAEVYLRDPTAYGLTDVSAPFAKVIEHGRLYNETVIGYRTTSGQTIIAPGIDHEVHLDGNCKLVAFATDYALTRPNSA